MAKTEVASHTIHAHEETYEGFIKGAMALSIIVGFIIVALCMFGFGTSYTFLIGFGGIVLGCVVTFMDASARSTKWILSLGTLVAYGLLVAAMIT